jgi:[NiFe] hydrogenase diaphorase moiety small subunit
MSETVTFKIDGKEITAEKNETIVEAARRAGVYIPTLCYFNKFVAPGACRICTVKVNGRYAAACKAQVSEGSDVENDTPELQDMRKQLIEAIFVEGNHFCPSCEKSGCCELQALAYRYQMFAPRFDYRYPNREIETRPKKLMIDRNRCILCKRCVYSLFTEDGDQLFTLSSRGNTATVDIDVEKADTIDDDLAQKAMDTCPVGSILKKRRGFVEPIGTRKYDKDVIGGELQEAISCAENTEPSHE